MPLSTNCIQGSLLAMSLAYLAQIACKVHCYAPALLSMHCRVHHCLYPLQGSLLAYLACIAEFIFIYTQHALRRVQCYVPGLFIISMHGIGLSKLYNYDQKYAFQIV